MQVHIIEGLEDELAWLLQKARQSHQGEAREPSQWMCTGFWAPQGGCTASPAPEAQALKRWVDNTQDECGFWLQGGHDHLLGGTAELVFCC